MKKRLDVEASARTPRRIRGRSKVLIASGLALAGVFAAALPAQASGGIPFYNISCNYGYYIALHSNGSYHVTHTMRQSGSDSSTNKAKSWDNGILGAVRVWGYGYQSNSFAQVYTTGWFVDNTSQKWTCS